MKKGNNTSFKTVLDMNYDDARNYFLKQENYCNFALPIYFSFTGILAEINHFLSLQKLADCLHKSPGDVEHINYKIYNNKDSKYAWRQMQIINPVLYVNLIRLITEKKHWDLIKNKFNEFSKDKKILCLNIPRIFDSKYYKKEELLHWWKEVEQRSIILALDYTYLYHTDITDCYNSIYTHSVAWALHTKQVSKVNKNKKNDLLGFKIDKCLQDMSYGQTNGIPIGSTLMDFIAEMVLGYADLEISKSITQNKIKDYQILRYRDDYRIFVNNENDGERILKIITEILIEIGLRLNPHKTQMASEVIEGSIKPDKLNWILKKQTDKKLQNRLIIIYKHSKEYLNAGSVDRALSDYFKLISNYRHIKEAPLPLISIAVDIAFHNPRTYPIITAILSKLISNISNKREKYKIYKKIKKRFDRIPNTGYMEIWLQRILVALKISEKYKEPLCKKVNGERVDIWNVDWISSKKLKNIVSKANIIDKKSKSRVTPVMKINEIQIIQNQVFRVQSS